MNIAELGTWLQERTALSSLSRTILGEIAAHLENRSIAAHQTVVIEGNSPEGLYILETGRIEIQTYRLQAYSLLPGAVINLQELLLEQPVRQTLITLGPCQLWFIAAEPFQHLIQRHPEINQAFSQQLVQEVEVLTSQLAYEQERLTTLQPYLVPKVKRGVVGKSRYAVKLRSQIIQAAQNQNPVMIFGEPGLEKDNLAALIHFSSSDRRKPMIKVDCSKLQTSGAELFGRMGGKAGLIEVLGEGTLFLNNVEQIPQTVIAPLIQLIQTSLYTPISGPGELIAEPRHCNVRLILVSEKIVPKLAKVISTAIKVVPLRVRKADIEDWVNYFISLICRDQRIRKVRITPEALRRLQAYDFPN
ncbi:MAG: sigma 54-interacting transcriptional regulator, partial [Microcoleaceae cyanobacterium]